MTNSDNYQYLMSKLGNGEKENSFNNNEENSSYNDYDEEEIYGNDYPSEEYDSNSEEKPYKRKDYNNQINYRNEPSGNYITSYYQDYNPTPTPIYYSYANPTKRIRNTSNINFESISTTKPSRKQSFRSDIPYDHLIPTYLTRKEVEDSSYDYNTGTLSESEIFKYQRMYQKRWEGTIQPVESNFEKKVSSYFGTKMNMEHPTFCRIYIGAPSSGKTVLCKADVLNHTKVVSPYVTIITESLDFKSMLGVKPFPLDLVNTTERIIPLTEQNLSLTNELGLELKNMMKINKEKGHIILSEVEETKPRNAIVEFLTWYKNVQANNSHNNKFKHPPRLLILDDCYTSIAENRKAMQALTSLVKNRHGYNLSIVITSQGPFKIPNDLRSAIDYYVFLSFGTGGYFRRTFNDMVTIDGLDQFFREKGKTLITDRLMLVIKNDWTPRNARWGGSLEYRIGKLYHYQTKCVFLLTFDLKPRLDNPILKKLDDYRLVYNYILNTYWLENKDEFKEEHMTKEV